jgi:23S rRNA pseudouridine955/2504/2580 synthase
MQEKFKIFVIDSNLAEGRLDRVIKKKFPNFPQSKIERSLRSKAITVNDLKSSSNQRLNEGDVVKILSSIVENIELQPKPFTKRNNFTPDDLKLISDNIIYRDADLIIINKPSGLAVQGGSKIKKSVDDLMPLMLDTLEVYEKPKHKLVHRLDKETSGILLIALNDKTAAEIALAFKERKVKKKYIAILDGAPNVNNGTISSIIDNKDVYLKEDNAFTKFKILKRKSGKSLIEFNPITGKKHQLRLHALELGCAIVGDQKYNPNYKDIDDAKLMLHAYEIHLPFKGGNLKISADLPDYFKQAIAKTFGNIYNILTH